MFRQFGKAEIRKRRIFAKIEKMNEASANFSRTALRRLMCCRHSLVNRIVAFHTHDSKIWSNNNFDRRCTTRETEMGMQTRNDIEAIFFAAIEKPPGAKRIRFLDEACRGNANLRREVEQLIAAYQTPDTFLKQPVDLVGADDRAVAETEGSQIGRYKLLEKLGEGGFGLVFMAEQTQPVRRKVALKIIKPGMDSKEVVARFEAERQALAMMDHPNIAKVLDAGTTDSGRPYFVMELVRGASLTEYCDTNRLETRERLRLFQIVCRAIQHAHQKGIIHRDLKPSNVMITLHDGRPVPKVIDFGVSKALSQPLTEKTLFTRYGQIVGTPQYMSPEQAEMSGLDVDTRSDIYSLGVLLYELLTGRAPFDAETLREAGFDGMRQIIREREPVKPSTCVSTLKNNAATLVSSQRSAQPDALRRTLLGDLDWIAMKCLEKDRNRRYETANDLISDIERHLADEPILAGPPSVAYQVRKFYRRNRAAALVAMLIFTTLLIALGGTALAWAQERDAKQQAEQAQAEAQQRADDLAIQTRKAEKTIEIFQRLLGGATPDVNEGPDATVRSFLSIFAEDLDKSGFEEPEVELAVRESLGAAYRRFSEEPLAAVQFEKAVAISKQLGHAKSLEHAKLLTSLALVKPDSETKAITSLLDEALRIAQMNQAIAEEVDVLFYQGELRYNEDALRKAIRSLEAMTPEQRSQVTTNPYRRLAWVLLWRSHGESVNLAQRAIDFAGEYLSPREVALSRSQLSKSLLHADDRTNAVRAADQAIDDAVEKCPDTLPIVLHARLDLENVNFDPNDRRVCAQKITRALDGRWSESFRNQGGPALGELIRMRMSLGDDEEVTRLTRLIPNLSLRQHHDAKRGLANAYREVGRLRKHHRISTEIIESLTSRRSIEVSHIGPNAWDFVERARGLVVARRYEEAIRDFKAALEIAVGDWNQVWISFELAVCLELMGKHDEAVQLFEKAAAGLEQHPNLYGEKFTSSFHALALLKLSQHDDPRISSLLSKGEIEGIFGIGKVIVYAARAVVAERSGRVKEAIKNYRLSMESRPGTFEQIHAEWIPERFVELADQHADAETVIAALENAISRRDETLESYHPERAYTRIRLADYLLSKPRDIEKATQLLNESREVYDYHGDWLPEREREKLNSLIERVEQLESSQDERKERQ